MDVLTDVLNALELKGWLHLRTEIAPPWRFDFLASRDSTFHVLSSGRGYLSFQAQPLITHTKRMSQPNFLEAFF